MEAPRQVSLENKWMTLLTQLENADNKNFERRSPAVMGKIKTKIAAVFQAYQTLPEFRPTLERVAERMRKVSKDYFTERFDGYERLYDLDYLSGKLSSTDLVEPLNLTNLKSLTNGLSYTSNVLSSILKDSPSSDENEIISLFFSKLREEFRGSSKRALAHEVVELIRRLARKTQCSQADIFLDLDMLCRHALIELNAVDAKFLETRHRFELVTQSNLRNSVSNRVEGLQFGQIFDVVDLKELRENEAFKNSVVRVIVDHVSLLTKHNQQENYLLMSALQVNAKTVSQLFPNQAHSLYPKFVFEAQGVQIPVSVAAFKKMKEVIPELKDVTYSQGSFALDYPPKILKTLVKLYQNDAFANHYKLLDFRTETHFTKHVSAADFMEAFQFVEKTYKTGTFLHVFTKLFIDVVKSLNSFISTKDDFSLFYAIISHLDPKSEGYQVYMDMLKGQIADNYQPEELIARVSATPLPGALQDTALETIKKRVHSFSFERMDKLPSILELLKAEISIRRVRGEKISSLENLNALIHKALNGDNKEALLRICNAFPELKLAKLDVVLSNKEEDHGEDEWFSVPTYSSVFSVDLNLVERTDSFWGDVKSLVAVESKFQDLAPLAGLNVGTIQLSPKAIKKDREYLAALFPLARIVP